MEYENIVPRRRRFFGLKINKKATQSLVGLFLVLSSLLLALFFVSSPTISVPFLEELKKYLGGGGLVFLPVILFLLGLNLSGFKFVLTEFRVILGAAILAFSSIGLLGLLLGERGGILGYKTALFFSEILTGLGAFLLLVFIILAAILLVFNLSIDSLINKFLWVSKIFNNLFASNQTSETQKAKERKEAELMRENEKNLEKERTVKVKGLEEALEIVEENEESKTRPIIFERPTLPSALLKKAKEEETIRETGVRKDKEGENTGFLEKTATNTEYVLPSLAILPDIPLNVADRGDIKKNAGIIEKTLESFGIQARVAEVNLGPSVTQYALELTEGTKIAKITALQNDLALSLAAPTGSVRIEAPIPGRSLVGIEVPNYSPTLVSLKSILLSDVIQAVRSKLVVALGHNVAGEPVVADLARWPHILIAGSTGSGKSVLIHSFLASILFRATPDEVKFILVDPKRVELTQYNGIPHLLTPVIVETEKVVSSLKWAVAEMEKRYKLFSQIGARNLADFNQNSEATTLPFIVIVVDELADIMAFAAAEVESLITRIAQMSRATGIHLVLSTQRPSVDVITGLIKANIPARIALNVSSSVDSRVIIDTNGAEKLLGRGDLLYLPPDSAKPQRIQGVFVSDEEQRIVVDYWRQFAPKVSVEGVAVDSLGSFSREPVFGDEQLVSDDKLFFEAAQVILDSRYASVSLLQRRLRVGYARGARLIDEMEQAGLVGPRDGASPREVNILKLEEFLKKSK